MNVSAINSSFVPIVVHADDEKLGVEEYTAIIQLVTVFLFGSVGNLLVINVFAWKKRIRRKRFESLLLLLALTDLFSSIFVPILFMYGTLTKYKQWHFGYSGCKVLTSLFPITITLSQGILVLISFERYKSITDPLGKKLSKNFVVLWLLTTVLAAFLLVSPFTYTLELINDEMYGINTCVPSGEKMKIIYLYSIGVFIRDFLATLAMLILSVLSSKEIKKGQQFLTGRGLEKRIRNFKTARKMLIVVVVVFSICVLPVDLFQVSLYTLFMANVKFGKNAYAVILHTNTFLTILQITNSATNILIYSKMHKDFKRNLFACVRKSNSFLKGSFTRMTFRNRSGSMTSLTGEFKPMSCDDDSLAKKSLRIMTINKSESRDILLKDG